MRMRMGEEGEMTENRVDVLCPGMIVRDGPLILEARSSATLVSRGERHLLVDVSGPQNRTALLDALRSRGIFPEQIEVVVLTHLHHDHDGNLDIFPHAKKYAHKLESPGPSFEVVSDDFDVWEGVRLIHTPGHTRGGMSVLVRSDETYALVGDAIPSADNVRKWIPPGLHYDADVALASMSKLVRMADVIVPGHGRPFRTAEFRKEGR
ncbi:MAG: MBL fold metallo-hydrolase [Methanomassiliicoccales archaeon]|nr:MBL fold metallo-hydrolase [Methanomassiliicoccales archaeon]